MDDLPKIRMWTGTFAEWMSAIGWSIKTSAEFLNCSSRRINMLKRDEPGKTTANAVLSRPERIAMLVALEAVADEMKRKALK